MAFAAARLRIDRPETVRRTVSGRSMAEPQGQTPNPRRDHSMEMVEPRGVEPLTSTMPL